MQRMINIIDTPHAYKRMTTVLFLDQNYSFGRGLVLHIFTHLLTEAHPHVAEEIMFHFNNLILSHFHKPYEILLLLLM
jgi:hypothetical protein